MRPTAHIGLQLTAQGIFARSLVDCSIPAAFDRTLRIDSAVDGPHLRIDGLPPILLASLKHLRILAAGKAAVPMLEALLTRLTLPSQCDLAGVLIAPHRPDTLPASIRFFAGGHPVPNRASFAGAEAALAMLRDSAGLPPRQTLCLFLISGGASAMMELPLDRSISLDDTVAFHGALVRCGATIVEMNCVRKHFSAVKGGRLALAAGRARKLSLFVSDVPPGQLDALASGPTLPDITTIDDCREVLARYSLVERLPPSVRNFFESPALPQTPKPGELGAPAVALLDSAALAEAAQSRAQALGFHTVIDNACDDLPYDRAAEVLLRRVRELRAHHPRCCLISAGEVSVPVPHFTDATSHVGGRNQHLALYLATMLRADEAPIAVLSAGSDGIDGNSSAAGAVIDTHTIANASDRESAYRALAAFDSSTWLAARNATIVTGPTGHNLRDLRILMADVAAKAH